MKSFIAALCAGLIFTVADSAGAESIASVVAVRGKAAVERGAKKLDAQPKLGIELQDTIATSEGGRIKLLFIDESVLTLAEKSRMNIDTFVHSKSDRGQSLFNLIDGKMRAVVGKTRFEVKTPTVVAAARGTVILFEVGTLNGQPFTRITCLEGIVDIRLLTAAPGAAPAMLSPGQSIVVTSDQAALPKPATLTPAEIEKLKKDTNSSASGGEITLPDSAPIEKIIGTVGVTPVATAIPIVPPLPQQQPVKTQPSRVDIGVKF